MNPKATYLKCLHLYCRQEGYPVNEEWVNRLPDPVRASTVKIINLPIKALPPKAAGLCTIESLEHYVEHHTHIRIRNKMA